MEARLSEFANQILIQKIGLTLLYSLGLGLLLAILAGCILLFTKKSTASTRYNLLTGLLFLFTLSTGLIFYNQIDSHQNHHNIDVTEKQVAIQNPVNQVKSPHISFNIADQIGDFIIKNASVLAIMWLLIVAFKTMQMAKGLYDLHYLKRNKLYSIGSYWENRLRDLATEIGVNRLVRIMQSGLVQIPMVMGHFKPIILVPLGVITSIPAEQIEMILLHELAHIRRMDFFVNLLQSFVELIFFFNPAVLWISALIRKERENCCDDIALAYAGNKKAYISALMSFSEYQSAESVYAMALAKESNLVQRAKRIAFQKNSSLKFTEKVFLGVTILLLFTFSILFAQASKTEKIVDTNLDEITIVGLKNPVLDTGNEQHKQDSARFDAVSKEKQQKTQQDLSIGTNLQEIKIIGLRSPLLKPQSFEPTSKKTIPLKINLPPLDTLPGKSDNSKKTYFMNYSQASLNMLSTDSSGLYKPAKNYQGSKFRYRTGVEPSDFERSSVSYVVTSHKFQKTSISTQILEEIAKSGISYNPENVTFQITNDFLMLNGVKQSSELHQKVMSALFPNPDGRLDFTYDSKAK